MPHRPLLENLPDDPCLQFQRRPGRAAASPKSTAPAAALSPLERQRVVALVIMSTIVLLFWLAFQQSGSTLTLLRRTVPLSALVVRR